LWALYRKLCDLAGIKPLEKKLSEEGAKQETRRAVLQSTYGYCQGVLWSERGDQARRYLHTRGFSDDDMNNLALGFYWSARQVKEALLTSGHAQEAIKDAGAEFPPLEGYITFPWLDDFNRPLTVYGTWHEKTPPKDKPKKMALKGDLTKRSPLYFDRARRANHSDLVLVEGLTDAALAQVKGDTRVISPVGNKLSHQQAQALARHKVRSVTLCLDPDGGGKAGTPSCIKLLEKVGITAYVAPWLPGGMDPDEFLLQHGLSGWRAHLADAVHSYRFHARTLITKHAAGRHEP
jgi:putative DNA primase/helicase